MGGGRGMGGSMRGGGGSMSGGGGLGGLGGMGGRDRMRSVRHWTSRNVQPAVKQSQ